MSMTLLPATAVSRALMHPLVKLCGASALLSLLLCLLVVTQLWYPAHKQVMQVEYKTQKLETEMRALIAQQQLAQQYRETLKAVLALENKLEADTTQARLINNLNALAKRHRVSLISDSSSEGRRRGAIMPLLQDVVIEGRYPGVRRLIQGIDQLPTWTVVQEIIIAAEQKNSATVVGTLKLVTYRQATQAQP